MEQIVYQHSSVHKDQLRAMLKDCGFELTPETFRDLHKDEYGEYSNIFIKVNDNKAVCLSPEEGDKYFMTAGVRHLHEILGPKVIHNAQITPVHPVTGTPAPNGGAYLTADIYREPMTPMPIGKTLYANFQRGDMTAVAIASGIFRDALEHHYHSITTEVDCGSRWTDGHNTIYTGESMGDGRIYKDMNAFDEKEGVCYISEEKMEDYEMDMCESGVKPISEYGVTYDELLTYARGLALRNPEQVARHCLYNATWQSVYTELEEFHNCCEPEDILELDEEILDRYNLFIEQRGQAPNYAEVFIEYKEDGKGLRAMIALNEKAGEYADDEVLFTCSNFEEFKRLAEEENGEDFKVCELYDYHAGTLDMEQELNASKKDSLTEGIDSRDNGATVFETEEKAEEVKLPCITDVKVFRNGTNTFSTEYKMRCKIDGIQQMGKLLTTAQVEDLANGADRIKMATEVFAKEINQLSIDRLQVYKTGLGR